jgi:hypothetical protein
MPDVPGRPQHNPMCVDETMMKWLMATLAGKKPDIDRVGLSYMLMGEARQGQGATPAKDPSQVKEWFHIGSHIMVVLPDSAKDALRGINQDLSNNQPYTSLLSSADVATPIWVRCKVECGEASLTPPSYSMSSATPKTPFKKPECKGPNRIRRQRRQARNRS